jgi:hypothetical protein
VVAISALRLALILFYRRLLKLISGFDCGPGSLIPTSHTAGAAASDKLNFNLTSCFRDFSTYYQIQIDPTPITSLHTMAGKKRAAPNLDRANKVRHQRSSASLMRYADSHIRNRNLPHPPRTRHLLNLSPNPLDLTRCIALCWTLRSSWSAC